MLGVRGGGIVGKCWMVWYEKKLLREISGLCMSCVAEYVVKKNIVIFFCVDKCNFC